jgi:hypothetical protein
MTRKHIDPARRASSALLAVLVGTENSDDFAVVEDDSLTGADVFFYNEFPDKEFDGFGGTVLYDIVTRNAADREEHCVLERLEGRGMALSCIEMDASGAYNVVGYLLAGEDATTQAAFLREAVQCTLQLAATPLLEAVLALQAHPVLPAAAVATMARELLSDENLSAIAGAHE